MGTRLPSRISLMNKILVSSILALSTLCLSSTSMASWFHKTTAQGSTYNVSPVGVPYTPMMGVKGKHYHWWLFNSNTTRASGYQYRKHNNCLFHMNVSLLCSHPTATITDSGLPTTP